MASSVHSMLNKPARATDLPTVTIITTPFDAWWGFLTNPINEGPTLLKVHLRDTAEIFTYDVDAGTSSFTDISNLDIGDIRGINDLGNFCGTYTVAKGKNQGYRGYSYDGVLNTIDDMEFSQNLNNSGDVIGVTGGNRPVLYHPADGSIFLDDVIDASDEEKAIWNNSGGDFIPNLSERNGTGFPVLAGTMRRLDSPHSYFSDGYVLFPIVP
jgi:hypothetical protein